MMGIKEFKLNDKCYPYLLSQISGAPKQLYVRGGRIDYRKAIAVVGTRRPTNYGVKVTRKLVKELVENGFVIVSGLAYGIDTVAHSACLESGGKTIAVMGTGIDRIYPVSNTSLAEKIMESGALVSEYRPGFKVGRGSFPARNRIISGMSLGVLVIEGRARSGTKITANFAADQGREVFAVPGSITSAMSEAPIELIQNGAKVVMKVEDILEELALDL